MNAKQTYRLGTAIKLTAIVSDNIPTGVTIKIEDPGDLVEVDSVAMTKDSDYVYTYIYQSLETDSEGEYTVTIKASYGGYTSLAKSSFSLEE